MSQIFQSIETEQDAGYFRIGQEVLVIPPESIATNRISALEELPTLRTEYPTAKRTGHARIDITITWQAVVDHSGASPDYRAWRQVRNILSMVKAAPFVEIYSPHVIQMLQEKDSSYLRGDRVAVALRQLSVATHPDIVDGLTCTLLMTVFNFKPYSGEFGYKGDSGQATDADLCDDFALYLQNWQSWNLPSEWDQDFGWLAVAEDVTTFNWRQYTAVALSGTADVAQFQAAQTSAPPASVNFVPPTVVMQKVITTAQTAGVDPYLALGVAKQESGFRQTKGGRTLSSSAGALGVMQLMPATAAGLGVDPNNIDQNISGGVSLLASYARQYNGNLTQIGQAYNQGPGAMQKGSALPSETQGWIAGVSKNMAAFKVQYPSLASSSTIPISSNAAQAQIATANAGAAAPPDLAAVALAGPSQAELQSKLGPLLQAGWLPDHNTDRVAFLYQPHSLAVGSEPLPTVHQVSVTVANNLPQIPLAAYAYPTYQHVGPSSTLVTITLISANAAAEGEEPSHPYIATLSRIAATLDGQAIEMRKEFRSTASIHRMQNVLVQNRVLNLMGVRAVMVASIDTDTVPQSPDLLQVTVAGSVYANIYENVDAWRVKGQSAQGMNAWNNVLKTQNIAALAGSPAAQRQLQPLIQYQNNLRVPNPAPIVAMLQSKVGQQYPKIAFPAGAAPSPVQLNPIIQELQQPGVADTLTPTVAFNQTSFAAQNPAVMKSLASGNPSYSDYLLASSSVTSKSALDAKAQIDAQVANAVACSNPPVPAPLATLYATYFRYQFEQNPLFNTAITEFERSPAGKQQFTGLSQPPSQDSSNVSGHGAYGDLGLLALNSQGLDLNPASYFVDDGRNLYKNFANVAGVLGAQAAAATISLNRGNGSNPNALDPTQVSTGLVQRVKRAILPPWSMSRAFPTFKLFLMEEDNSDVFYAYDDFYSYSSVISMEVIRYQDKPDMAVIVLGNATNLLTHKLFDNSTIGKWQQKLANPWMRETPRVPGGGQVSTPPGALTFDAPTRLPGNVTVNTNGSDNLVPGFGNQNLRAPYQYYALQTGAKIQLRMGYANNPDQLYPVFTGKITQIEPGETLTIVGQGFLLELMESSAKSMPHGTQGGWTVFSDRGDAEGLMTNIIKSPRASHFGHWQVNQTVSNLARGYDWIPLASAAAAAVGFAGASAAIANSYDRSAENILIDRSLNVDGSTNVETGSDRSWTHERSWLNIIPPKYSIPDDPQVTPWRILRDVARRYPECMLLVKPYGFPYGADATLVFANPNDWYKTRPALIGEDDVDTVPSNPDPVTTQTFATWWGNAQTPGPGRQMFANALTRYQDETGEFGGIYYRFVNPGNGFFSGVLDEGFDAELKKMLAAIDTGGLKSLQALRTAVTQTLENLLTPSIPTFLGGSLIPNLIGRRASGEILQREMEELYRQLRAFLLASTEDSSIPAGYPKPGDQLQPVRKWHMITSAHIIRNNIKLNEQVYNAVLVDKKVYLASGSIPEQYQRVLDCDPKIVAPEKNLSGHGLANHSLCAAYAQSFLKEEIGKMYGGELELTGMPEIDAGDAIMLSDTTRGMVGPIEVESVIHSFTLEGGYITIVRPRALVLVNESASAGVVAALGSLWNNMGNEISSAIGAFSGATSEQKAAGVTSAAAVTAGVAATGYLAKAGLGSLATAGVSAGTEGGAISAATSTVVQAITGGAAASETVASVAAAAEATGSAIAGVATVAGEAVGVAGGFLFGGWALAALAVVGLSYGFYCLASDRQSANPLMILPLSQYERPWVAGIEGWQLTDLTYLLANKFEAFNVNEIQSTIEGFRKANNLLQIAGH